jgi:hypothetical protein
MLMWGVLDTTLCDKICRWFATGQWFSPGTPVSSIKKNECHDINEILLKLALNTITQPSLSKIKDKLYKMSGVRTRNVTW